MNFVDLMNRLTTTRALIFGILVAVFYYFAVFDSGDTQKAMIAASQSRMTELENEIQESQRKLDRAMVYKKTAAEVGSTINKLLSLIPERFSMPDLMRIVSNEAKVAGSSLEDIKPGSSEVSPVAKEFEEINVSVNLNGSFLQHMVFLSNLTKIPQILIIKRFDLSVVREAKGEEAAVVKMAADIVAFRYRGATAAAEEPKPPGQ
ncbi:MAG: type 4a pilus biogenesis protein PilO [Bdellovibrionales bacterium]|nr:type 4a pilus biogenesis protein PilO [Bdellovibrionales bacterium]